MSIHNRLSRLESKSGNTLDDLPTLKVHVIKSREQAENPEMFDAVLDETEIGESSATVERYHYE